MRRFLNAAIITLATFSSLGLQAREGGVTSGGGNAGSSKPLTERELLSAHILRGELDENGEGALADFFLTYEAGIYKLAFLEQISERRGDRVLPEPSVILTAEKKYFSEDYAIIQKLFHGRRDIIDVLRNAQVEFARTGPCLDIDGKPVDGSVYSSVGNNICFSVPRLLKKLHSDNYQRELEALAIHELSHKLGTTEDEANRLQQIYLNPHLTSIGGLSVMEMKGGVIDNRDLLAVLRGTLDNLDRIAEATSETSSCQRVAQALERLTVKLDNSRKNEVIPNLFSFSGVRLKNEMGVMAIWTKLLSLESSCLDENSEERKAIALPFGNQTEMPMSVFISNYHDLVSGDFMPGALTPNKETVRLLTRGDKAAFSSELNALKKQTEAVFAEVHKDIWGY